MQVELERQYSDQDSSPQTYTLMFDENNPDYVDFTRGRSQEGYDYITFVFSALFEGKGTLVKAFLSKNHGEPLNISHFVIKDGPYWGEPFSFKRHNSGQDNAAFIQWIDQHLEIVTEEKEVPTEATEYEPQEYEASKKINDN